MSEPALKLKIVNRADERILKIRDRIIGTHTQEMIIGLCGPIGTDIHLVANCLEDVLSSVYHYECKIIRLSDLIRRYYLSGSIPIQSVSYDQKVALINAGNELRQANGNSILAEFAINEIAVSREINKEDEEFRSQRICYIIDSIKNKDELDLLKSIYNDIFYFIGVFSNIDIRVKNLSDSGLKLNEIYSLIDIDSGEEMNFGQRVSETFVESDFFLREDNSSTSTIQNKLKKYLNLIFSSEVVTPTANETAMYQASAAAGNSACLSRQVGASITDKNGEMIAVGWNDVPKAGGGVYQTSEFDSQSEDKRCVNLGEGVCYNDKEKSIISEALASELEKGGVIDSNRKNEALNIIKKSRIKELIEFSRAVHAEMHAIISGSQKTGSKMIGGKLFCTTYPCHNCARHIIAAGIKEVYYIEPYRKSLATRLHNDAITEDESKSDLVRILMFDGVSPKRYLEFYKMSSPRKKEGRKIRVNLAAVLPKNTLSLQGIPILEKKVTEDLIRRKLIPFQENA